MMKTVIKKELRGYFNSLVAAIFLTVFVAVTLGSVFGAQKFFARGVADLRPLFVAMPLLLIIVASVLSMRMWAEERRTGTLEVLLTLPVPRWQLVVGKFIAGLVLIAVALALTLELPITIAFMGNLDLGPVIGGYLAALLLSAVYLAIGMCVSALTDNQIVAFIGTAALCAIAYLIGYLGEIGHLFGTGARFASVARGVLDLRDLAYYGGIIAFGIVLNVVLLQRLTWGHGEHGRARRMGALLGVALIALNAIALDVWLSPVRRARIDLTQEGSYSLSDATRKILGGLDERLLIRGYFSEKTHPKLAPLVPQIRDLLEEYKIAGGSNVRVEMIDPASDEDAKREAKERFNIDPRPLQFASQTEKALINAYFAIAIEYGNQHAVIGLEDLISVRRTDIGDDVEITLKNPEYELTKTIKKTVSEFSSVDAMFASTAGKVKLTAYITPATLPADWKDAPAKLKKVVDDLAKQSGGKLEFATIEPKTEADQRELYGKYRLRPYPDLETGEMYYFDLLMQVGNRLVRIVPPQQMNETELKASLTEGLKRAAPGFTRVVGLWSPPASSMPPPMPGMPPQEVPPQQFNSLRRSLAGNYEVRDIQLTQPIPDDVEALVVAGPASLDAKSVEDLDQFVMRGGALVLLDGRYRIAPSMGEGLAVEKVATGLEAMLEKWGITVADQMVWDTKADNFPMPVAGAGGVREMRQQPLPYFVKIDGEEVSSASPITNGLAGSVMHWVSPVKADAKVGDDAHRVDALLKTSPGSWLSTNTMVQPDPKKYPETGFPGPAADLTADKKGSQVVAVAVVGGFASSVAKGKPDKPQPGNKEAAHLLDHSPPDARVVVFGSSSFASDEMLGMAQQLGSELALSNVELVHNAVDWSLADTELLAIRSRNEAARALTIDPSSAGNWIVANAVIAVVGLIVVVVVLPWMRRRSVTPLAVSKEA